MSDFLILRQPNWISPVHRDPASSANRTMFMCTVRGRERYFESIDRATERSYLDNV